MGIESSQATHGKVRVSVHNRESLQRAAQDRGLEFDTLEKSGRYELARSVEPDSEQVVTNTTLVDLHEYIVDVIDPNQSPSSRTATHLAVGTDGTTPTSSDSALGNEVYRLAHSDRKDQNRDFWMSSFLDTSEANGHTLREVGTVTASSGGLFLNRALINEEPKNDQKTMTIDVTLKFREG